MKKRISIIFVAAVVLLASCQSYTAKSALERISVPTTTSDQLETRYSAIFAKEQEAKYEDETASAEQHIARLSDEISLLEKVIATYESDTTVQQLTLQILEKEELLRTRAEELAAVQNQLAQLAADRKVTLNAFSELHERSALELERFNEEREEKLAEIALLNDLIEAYESDESIEILQREIVAQASVIDSLGAEIAERDSAFAALQKSSDQEREEREERISSLLRELGGRATDEDVSRWYEQITELEEKLKATEAKLLRSDAEMNSLRASIAALQDEKDALILAQADLVAELAEVSATLVAEQKLLGTYRAEQQAEEQLRKALQQAEKDRLERERYLASQLPELQTLRIPHQYTAVEEPELLAKGAVLNTLFLPLGEELWESEKSAQQVVHSISDLSYPVLFVTGAMENVLAVIKALGRNAVVVEGGAIITNFKVQEKRPHGIRVALNEKQSVHLSLANLVEAEVFGAFFDPDSDWQAVQHSVNPDREEKLLEIVRSGSLIDPTIMAASLYEPSHQDWSVFSPITYRQTDYLWPLAAAVEEEGFYDTYRITHFAAETDSGNTYVTDQFAERFDFIFSRKALPLETAILPIGALSAASEARWAVLASFLIP